jgi:acetylornithine aminotransferase
VVDEVQTGMGRTGAWLAIEHPHLGGGVVPDVVTLAKGLGGGFPIGAMIALGAAGAVFGRGQHGSTFGGNPVAAMAALTTMGVIARDGLLDHVRELGARWREEIASSGNPLVAAVRGEGLLIAVELSRDVAPAVQTAALDAGFIVNAVAPDAIRLAPPLVLTAEQAASFTQFLAHVEVPA